MTNFNALILPDFGASFNQGLDRGRQDRRNQMMRDMGGMISSGIGAGGVGTPPIMPEGSVTSGGTQQPAPQQQQSGGLSAARDMALNEGMIDLGMQMQGRIEQNNQRLSDQQLEQGRRVLQGMQALYHEARTPEERAAFYQRNPERFAGLPQPESLDDFSDQTLGQIISMMEAELGQYSAPAIEETNNQYFRMGRNGPELLHDARDAVAVDPGDRLATQTGQVLLGPDEDYVGRENRTLDIRQQEADTGRINAERPSSPLVVVNPNDPSSDLTPMQQEVDEAWAGPLVEWQMGGSADATRNLQQVGTVLERLESGDDLTGPLLGMVPPSVRVTFNQESVDTQQLLEEVVQRNLRVILGAQFTNEEGKRLIDRAYNPQADEAVNRARVASLFRQMQQSSQAMDAALDHYTEFGTMRGYTGRAPSIEDFYRALDAETGGQNRPARRRWNPETQRMEEVQ